MAKQSFASEQIKSIQADTAVLGGGASGLAAAIELARMEPDMKIVMIEKNGAPGRKIRATGNGRCNITNTGADGYEEASAWLRSLGMAIRVYDNGLVYPYSETAADVADLLELRAREGGVEIITDASVSSVSKNPGGNFAVMCDDRDSEGKPRSFLLEARRVVLALGGKAGPMYGTTGDGYAIARSLGHKVVTPVPVLTAVECAEFGKNAEPDAVILGGTRARAEVTLLKEGSPIFSERGEVQFTKSGLSGICVFNLTRYMRYDRTKGESLSQFAIRTDLFADGDMKSFLEQRRENAAPSGEKAGDVLRTVVRPSLAEYVIAVSGIDPEGYVSALTDAEINRIAENIHGLVFRLYALKGWKEAQATAGGVSLDEIDGSTCGSKLHEGLYITGELADTDLPCGGYNLTNAWITGIKAARAIAAAEADAKTEERR